MIDPPADPLRRRLLLALGASTASSLLTGCDRLTESPAFSGVLRAGEALTYRTHRALLDRNALAREFTRADLSPVFRANGTMNPGTPEYSRHRRSGFADWRLTLGGLVANPLSIGLRELMTLPQRTQITRHDCVEGWSAIGQWTGPALSTLLDRAGLSPRARFIVFHCADRYDGAPYYESIDLVDAFHPQTILAWRMNDRMLPVAHGAPLRLRVERQLGYKHAKYVMRIEARERLDDLYGGRGGYWEDSTGYEWYAGI
jgi:DMSO/TMAO reductase YedYZ molybdopterin-dependent catalytic subunit